MDLTTIILIPIIMYSVILHEIAHGYAAFLLGDDTAKRQSRLSLNPLHHIDKVGTIIIPIAMLILSGGKFAFGYAKPVPINPYNFRNYKRDTGITAIAGPATNLAIAIILSLIVRYSNSFTFIKILYNGIYINLFLMLFNLIPFPPLDGSKVLGIFLSDEAYFKYTAKEKLGMQIFFGMMILNHILHLNIFGIFDPVLNFLMKILLG